MNDFGPRDDLKSRFLRGANLPWPSRVTEFPGDRHCSPPRDFIDGVPASLDGATSGYRRSLNGIP